MLKNFPIIKSVISFIIPYIILYAIYIQLNGELSPGGGFQAGVIFASGIIGFNLVNPEHKTHISTLIVSSVLGVMIYAGCGLVSFFYDDNYLNYYSISKDSPIMAQNTGIFIIELGVGLTVASIMCLIYLSLKED